MRRTILPAVLALLAVGACSVHTVLQYDLKLQLADSGKALELVNATERVLKRKFTSLRIPATASAILVSRDAGTLTIKTDSAQSARRISDVLTQPFTFDIRVADEPVPPKGTKVPPNQPLDWQPTGLTGAALNWIQVIGDKTTGKVGVELEFSAAGHRKLGEIFAKNNGKSLGLFVRDLLVSKVTIAGGPISEHIIISGIPSFAVGEVFADDVNVGLHVRFIPATQTPSVPGSAPGTGS